MDRDPNYEHYLQLVASLKSNRTAMLSNWRRAVLGDDEEATAQTLSRAQLTDHIPQVLDDFERSLLRVARSGSEGNMEDAPGASDHGLHRWQQGYRLPELTREWGHLHLCLLNELEDYSKSHPEVPQVVMLNARRVLAQLCIEGVSNSTQCYFDLHRRASEGHVKDLEEAVRELNELERRRAELWRGAAHDLRGSVGAVKSATVLVNRDEDPSAESRDKFLDILKRSVASLQTMLNSVVDLARLEAGHEQVTSTTFDAAQLIKEVAAGFEATAQERNLYLKMKGPAELVVEGDAPKVRRIAQNLILNALKYTEIGGVTLEWAPLESDAAHMKWSFTVTDTGPGILAGPGSPLTAVLKEATDLARESEGKPPSPSVALEPAHQLHGEGIGLSIVKGLSNLLDATIELQGSENGGTVFRVIFPAQYKF